MKRIHFLGGFSLIALINATFIIGMQLGGHAALTPTVAIVAMVVAISSLFGLTAVSALIIAGEAEALEKVQQLELEIKALKRAEQEVQANILRERSREERGANDGRRKPHSPIRPYRPSAANSRQAFDLQVSGV